jgi:hypothetical protein
MGYALCQLIQLSSWLGELAVAADVAAGQIPFGPLEVRDRIQLDGGPPEFKFRI